MIRRPVVILLVLVGFGLIIWAGVSNYRVRQVKKIAAERPGQQLVLTTQGVATPAPAPGADSAETPMPVSPLLGQTAPNFRLKDAAGKQVSLASYRGRPVLVNFWASWCGPCKYEIPWLTVLQTKYAAKGFQILGVDSDELGSDSKKQEAADMAKILSVAHSLHINYPVLYGGATISNLYGGVDFLPQSFYINRSGKVVAVITGAGSEQEAEADIKKAIGSGA